MSEIQAAIPQMPVAEVQPVPSAPLWQGDSGFGLEMLAIQALLSPAAPTTDDPALPEATVQVDEAEAASLAAWIESSLGLSARFSPPATPPHPISADPTVQGQVADLPEAVTADPTTADEAEPAIAAAAPQPLPVSAESLPVEAAAPERPERAAAGEATKWLPAGRSLSVQQMPRHIDVAPEETPVNVASGTEKATPAEMAPLAAPRAVMADLGLSRAAVTKVPAMDQGPAPVAEVSHEAAAPQPTKGSAALSPEPISGVAPAEPAPTHLEAVVPDPAASDLRPLAPSRHGAAVTTVLAPAHQHDARPVLQQVTEALVSSKGDRTEIALSPEELGRVRMVMSGTDRAHITIWAERPETLELVRRNADMLTQHLAEAGVDAGSLDFRQDTGRQWQETDSLAQRREDDDPHLAASALVRLAPAPLSDRRIDIRL